jgi:hypothetical protein
MATEETTSKDHDPDLAWLLTCGGSAMGERGTLGGIVAALEHGGHPGGVPNTDLYTDQQIGCLPSAPQACGNSCAGLSGSWCYPGRQ